MTNKIHVIKDALCMAVGALGAFVSACFGGWDAAMTTLMIFMIIDYATGMIVAAVFHRSEKTAAFPVFSVDENGHVIISRAERLGTTTFRLTEAGHLEVTA